ncbi:MAG TPA: hypothetical protein VMI32_03650 [Candidatus Solibacter sp.]|nr:hypothetical protein [Candidatus Solibacter sp.]
MTADNGPLSLAGLFSRPVLLVYITSQLLRTRSALREAEAVAPTQIVLDSPRPIRG